MSSKQNIEWRITRGSHCEIKQIKPKSKGTANAVITLSSGTNASLLAMATPVLASMHEQASKILKSIRDSSIAAMLDVKQTAVSKAPFRLVIRQTGVLVSLSQPPTSFVALSYCWHNAEWSNIEDASTVKDCPISPVLFEALIAEIGPNEGVWIDQLCIDQTNAVEKAYAVGAMDIVYQSARLVVVVLEDIRFDHDDESILGVWLSTIESGQSWYIEMTRVEGAVNHRLVKLMWKIFSARWFTRAWCAHELLLSRSHIFLVRGPDKPDLDPTVVRFTSEFLFDLCMLQARLASIWYSKELEEVGKKYNRQRTRFARYMLAKVQPTWRTAYSDIDEGYTRSYMRVFSEISQYNSSLASDKLNIALNVLGCGVWLTSSLVGYDQCCSIFYHIAMAAKDPTVLVASGERLARPRWMRQPLARDFHEPYVHGARHFLLEHIPFFDDHEIHLDVVVVGSSSSLRRASMSNTRRAEKIIGACLERTSDQHASLLDEVIRGPAEAAERRRQFYTDLLACVIECGADWTIESFRERDPDQLNKVTKQGIIECFSVPESDSPKIEGCEMSLESLYTIIDLLDALVGLWLSEEPEAGWNPAWVQISHSPEISMLFLCPGQENYDIAIPTLLLHPRYNFLKRLWFLSADDQHPERYQVLGKTCFFGTSDLLKMQHDRTMGRSLSICG